MQRNIKLIVFPVNNIQKAKIFYSKFLETEPYVDSPHYVGYRIGDQEIGLDPNTHAGPISYVEVSDIKSSLEEMVKAGGEIMQDVKDVGGGLLIAQVEDDDGNVVGFRQQPQ